MARWTASIDPRQVLCKGSLCLLFSPRRNSSSEAAWRYAKPGRCQQTPTRLPPGPQRRRHLGVTRSGKMFRGAGLAARDFLHKRIALGQRLRTDWITLHEKRPDRWLPPPARSCARRFAVASPISIKRSAGCLPDRPTFGRSPSSPWPRRPCWRNRHRDR